MESASEEFSIISAFMNFAELGAEWVMWLMLILGFFVLMFAIERLWLYLSTQVNAPFLASRLLKHLDNGEVDTARKLVSRGKAMEERVLSDALGAYEKGPAVVEEVMMGAVAREKLRYDRFLSYMGTVGSNTPFIGLFGTVIGIILAFKELGRNPKGGLEVVGPAIAEALVATAVGLLVAIPAVAFYNAFKKAQQSRVGNTDFLGRMLLAHLNRNKEEG